MNAARHRYWTAYIRELQGRMLLADWEVVLVPVALTDNIHDAGVWFSGPSKEAAIRLSVLIDDLSRQRQRHVIVHELLHLHMHGMKAHFEMQMQHTEGCTFAEYGHRSHEEFAVDDLARIIAPHVPLPPKVSSHKTCGAKP